MWCPLVLTDPYQVASAGTMAAGDGAVAILATILATILTTDLRRS
jgi:hypothetical protein